MMIVTATMMAMAAAMGDADRPPEEMALTEMLAELKENQVDVNQCTERAEIEKALAENRASRT